MKVNPFQQALTTYRTIIVATMIFSIAINVLMFVSPLYMLQVYDRVLHSRSEMTLIMLTVIALAMLALYGLLEWIRSRVLVRAGLRFDEIRDSEQGQHDARREAERAQALAAHQGGKDHTEPRDDPEHSLDQVAGLFDVVKK